MEKYKLTAVNNNTGNTELNCSLESETPIENKKLHEFIMDGARKLFPERTINNHYFVCEVARCLPRLFIAKKNSNHLVAHMNVNGYEFRLIKTFD